MKLSTCKHCNQIFDLTEKPSGWMANHSRWCDKNPKKKEYKNGSLKAVEAMNLKRKQTGITNQFQKLELRVKKYHNMCLRVYLLKVDPIQTRLKKK